MKEQKKKIKGWFIRAAQSIANKLNGWINPLSPVVKKGGLITIGLLTSMACVILVIESVRSNQASSVLEVDPITKPIDIFPQDTVPVQQTEQDIIRKYNRMIQWKQLVDKLNASSNEKAIDSLMEANPGLRDSLNEFIENYYPH